MRWLGAGLIVVAAVIGFIYWTAGPGTLDALDWARRGGNGAFVHEAAIPFGSHGQTLDVWKTREGPAVRPVIVFFYGGGWAKGSADTYGWAARALAEKGFVVVLPDYRKVPDVAYPAFVQDGAEAIRWTRDTVGRFGGDPTRMALSGHSAGGYIAAALTLDRQWLTAAGVDPGIVKAAVGLSGPYDFYPFTGRAVAAFGRWPRPAETQPIVHARADAPPMMLVTGTEDTTVRPKNARNLAARLKALGAPVVETEYPGLGHEDIVIALSVPFRTKAPVLDDMSRFLMATLAKGPRPAP